MFSPANAGQRVDYAASSIIGHVPKGDRTSWEAVLGGAARDKLKTAVAAWYGASSLSHDAFRDRLLPPGTGDETVDRLRSAAEGIVDAGTVEELTGWRIQEHISRWT